MQHGIPLIYDETLQLLQKTVYDFATREIQPLADDIDAGNVALHTLFPQLGQLGLLGLTVPTEYGGTAAGYLAHAITMEALSHASGSLGLSYGAHSNLCINQIVRYGSPEQKARFLPDLVSGVHIGALAISEAGAGSDALGMRLTATPTQGGYRLNGTKLWTTNGPDANVVVVYAKHENKTTDTGRPVLSAFVIQTPLDGFSTAQTLSKLGMRGSPTCELIFNDCFVPVEHVLGEPGQGVEILMSGLDFERVILAAGPVGIMQACMDVVLPYTRERKQFGRPIGEFQLMQGKVADMYTLLNASRAYLYAAATACDQGSITRQDAASVILYTAENATQVALQAIQCLGGNGYINDYPTGRFLRDAKLYEIGAGTSEIRRMLIGRALFTEQKRQN